MNKDVYIIVTILQKQQYYTDTCMWDAPSLIIITSEISCCFTVVCSDAHCQWRIQQILKMEGAEDNVSVPSYFIANAH